MEHVYNLNDLKNVIDVVFFFFSFLALFLGFCGMLSNLYMFTKLIPGESVGGALEIKQEAKLYHRKEIEKNLIGFSVVLFMVILYLLVGHDLHLHSGSLHVCQC